MFQKSFFTLFSFLFFLVVLKTGIQAAATGPETICGIDNFGWAEENVLARGRQPNLTELECLRDNQGIRAVINFRQENNTSSLLAQSLGLDYQRIPVVDDEAPFPAQVSEFFSFVVEQRAKSNPIFIHCAGGRGRAGTFDALYLMWRSQEWTTQKVLERFVNFGAKISCDNAGNGQIQAIREIGQLLGKGTAFVPSPDLHGNYWQNCPRPGYMSSWDYQAVVFPPSPELTLTPAPTIPTIPLENILIVLTNWGENEAGDFNNDGKVNSLDFGYLIST